MYTYIYIEEVLNALPECHIRSARILRIVVRVLLWTDHHHASPVKGNESCSSGKPVKCLRHNIHFTALK